jgi:hypothetical protein
VRTYYGSDRREQRSDFVGGVPGGRCPHVRWRHVVSQSQYDVVTGRSRAGHLQAKGQLTNGERCLVEAVSFRRPCRTERTEDPAQEQSTADTTE